MKEGYVELVGSLCEQQISPKLLTKFLQIQTRLLRAQQALDSGEGAGDDAAAFTSEKRPQKRTKELTFILPLLDEVRCCFLCHKIGYLDLNFRVIKVL